MAIYYFEVHYPLEALREAVVNAVIHRDYSRRGESIRVFYYADYVEYTSPFHHSLPLPTNFLKRNDGLCLLRSR